MYTPSAPVGVEWGVGGGRVGGDGVVRFVEQLHLGSEKLRLKSQLF